MRKNFTKAIKQRKIWDNATVTLSNNLPIFNSNHLIIRNILSCLSTKDWSKLV